MGKLFDAYNATRTHTVIEENALVQVACDDLGIDYWRTPLTQAERRRLICSMNPDHAERALVIARRQVARIEAVNSICTPRDYVAEYEPICDDDVMPTVYRFIVGTRDDFSSGYVVSRRVANTFTRAAVWATPSGYGFSVGGGSTIWRIPESEVGFIELPDGTTFANFSDEEIEAICPAAWMVMRDKLAAIDPEPICETAPAEDMQVALF